MSNKKLIFKKAHKMAARLVEETGSYRVAFSKALKSAWVKFRNTLTVERAVVGEFFKSIKREFTVKFVKVSTGEVREMKCKPESYSEKRDLVTVIDVDKDAYRSFKLSTAFEITVENQTFAIV